MCFGSSNQQTSTTSTALDPGLRDRLYNVLDQGTAAASLPYQGYDAPRIADFTADQQAGMGLVRANVGAGNQVLGQGIDAAARAANYTPQQVSGPSYTPAQAQAFGYSAQGYTPAQGQSSSYQAQGYDPAYAQAFGYSAQGYDPAQAQSFGYSAQGYDPARMEAASYQAQGYTAAQMEAARYEAALANRGDVRNVAADQVHGQGLGSVDLSQYMNPYTQSVVNSTVDEINRSYDRSGQQQKGIAAMSGAFGGDRAAIENAENDRNRASAIGSATSNLLSSGFANAQSQAQTDLSRGLQAQGMNQSANLQAAGLNAGYDSSFALANQAARNTAGQFNAANQQAANAANQSATNAASQFAANANNTANQFNAANQQAANAANQSATNAALSFGASAANTANQFTAGNNQAVSLANQSAKNAAGQFLANAGNAAAQYTAGNNQAVSLANQSAHNAAGQFGANATNAAGQYNAGNSQAMTLANLGAQNAALSFGANATNAAGQYNAGNNQAVSLANMGSNNAAMQWNGQMGFNAQQANQQAGLSANGQALTGGGLLGSLAQQRQAMGYTDANSLYGIGAQQQGLDQQNLTMAYNDFVNQRDYPKSQIGWLGSVINGSAASREGTTTASVPGPSAVSQIGGLAATGLGLYGLGSSMGWFADGGMVEQGLGAYADGGLAVDWTTQPDDILQHAASNGDMGARREISRRADAAGFRSAFTPDFKRIGRGLATIAPGTFKAAPDNTPGLGSVAPSSFSGAYPALSELPAQPQGLGAAYALGTDDGEDDVEVPQGGEVDEADPEPTGIAGAIQPYQLPPELAVYANPPQGLGGADIGASDGGLGSTLPEGMFAPIPGRKPEPPPEGGEGGAAAWAMPALQFGLNLMAQRGPNALSNIGQAGASTIGQVMQQKRLDVQDRRQGNVEKRLDRQLALAEGRAAHQDRQDETLLPAKAALIGAQTDAARALATQRNTPDAGTTALTTNINALVKLGVAKDPQEAYALLNSAKDKPFARETLTANIAKMYVENGMEPDAALKKAGQWIAGATQPARTQRAAAPTQDAAFAQAKSAIARGADPAQIKARLAQLGYDVSGF